MYLQITDHCNMACAHCCYSCSPRKKNFMPEVLVDAAIDFILENEGEDCALSIGGGEPTLHPRFWSILGQCMGSFASVWLATNGSQTKTALALAGMAEKGVIGCDLSLDPYHAAIDQRVISAFKGRANGWRSNDDDRRGIRDVTQAHKSPLRAGRAIRTQVWVSEGCCCEDHLIDPHGNVWSCGCKKLLVGHVLSGWNRSGELLRESEMANGECLFHSRVGKHILSELRRAI